MDILPPGPSLTTTAQAPLTGRLDLQQLAQAVGGAVLIIDDTGHYVDVAAADPGQLFAPRDSLIGASIFDFSPKASAEQRLQLIKLALATGQPQRMDYSRVIGEAERWFNATVTALSDHEALWVARDVTEQRRLENLSEIQRDILRLIATGAPLGQVLDRLVRVIESRIDGGLCSILKLDAQGQHLLHVAAPSLPPAFAQAIDGQAIGPQAGSCGTAVFRRQLVIVEDIESDPLWQDYRGVADAAGLRACWSQPILATAGQVWGTFGIYYATARAPRPAELELVETAASLASIAFERDQAEQTLRQAEAAEREKAAVLETVRQASLRLNQNLDFPAVLSDLLQAVYGLVDGARNVHVYLYDPETDQLSFGAAVREDGQVRPLSAPRVNGLTYTVAHSGQVVVVPDTLDHPLYANTPERWGRASIGIPLKIGSRMVGVMTVAYTQPRTFGEAELRQLELLADQAASAVENARLFQAERAAREQADALREAAGSLLTPGLSRDQVLQLILEQLARVVEYDSASIMLTEAHSLTLAAHRGLRSDVQSLIPSLQLRGMEHIQDVIDRRRTAIIQDTAGDPRWQPLPTPATNYVRCWMGVPLATKERVIGVLNVDKETPNFYNDHHARLAAAFANQAALAIEQTSLYGVLAREAERLNLLNQLSRDLSTRLDPEQVYAAIYRATSQLMPCEAFIIALLSDSGDSIKLSYLIDKGQRYSVQLPVDRGLSAQVLKGGKPLRVDNMAEFVGLEPFRFGDPDHVQSLLMVPMFLGQKVIGLLSAQSYSEHSYTDLEEQTLGTLAYQAAVAIENARLYAETRDQLRDQKLLHECGLALAVVHDPRRIFEIVAEQIASRFEATSITYYSFEVEIQQCRVDFEYWTEQASQAERRSVIGQESKLTDYPITLKALTTLLPQTIHRGQPNLTPAELQSLSAFEGQCVITVPLALHGQAVGFFEIWNSRADRLYSESDERLLLSLVAQTAIALENAKLFAETRRQSLELDTLLDAARAVSSTLEVEDIIDIIVRKMTESTNAVGTTISRWDQELNAVVTWVTYRQRLKEHSDHPGNRYPLDHYPITREVLHHKTRRLITVSDTQADPAELEVMRRAHISNMLLLPLIIGERVIGLVEVFDDSLSRKFAADEIDLIQGMTNQAAIAIANAQLFGELNQEKRRIELLYDLSRSLAASLEPYEVGQRALDRMCEAFGAFQGAVYLVENGSDRIHLVALSRSDPTRIEALDRRMDFRVGRGLTGWVASQREAVVVDNVQVDAHWVPIPGLDEEVHSIIAAPLVAGNNLVGVINLSSNRAEAFQRDQIPLFQAAAAPVAAALHNAQLFYTVRRQADEVQIATTILHALNAVTDVTQAFPTFIAGLRQMTHCDRVSLALLDEAHQVVTIAALDRPRVELFQGVKFPIETTAAAADVLAGHIHKTPDLAAEVAYQAERSLYETGFRSRLNVPLRVGLRILGSLNLVWPVENGYSTLNLELMNQIADALALAIEKNRLFDESRRRDAILESLAYGSQRLLMPGNLPDNIMDTLASLGQVVGVSRVYVFENHPDETGEILTSLLYEWCSPNTPPQLPNPSMQNVSYTGGMAMLKQVLSEGNPLYGLTRDIPQPERLQLDTQNVRSLALMPIFSGGRWWGFLGFDDCEQDRNWTVAEIETLKNAAATLGAAVARQESETAEREQRVLAEALRDTASALNSTLNIDEVLDRILENVGLVVPHDAASISMINEHTWEAYVVRRAGFRATQDFDVLSVRISVARAPNLQQMIADRQPCIISDTRLYPGWIEFPQTRWVRSYLGAPIVVRGNVIGFLNLDSLTPGFFTAQHADQLQAFANEAALAIQNAQLFAAAELHVHTVTVLNEITRAALETTDYLGSLQDLADKMKDLIDASGCYITLWEEGRGRPSLAATPAHTRHLLGKVESAPRMGAETLTGLVLDSGRTLVVDDIYHSEIVSPQVLALYGNLGAQSLMCLPLVAGGRRLGAVFLTFDTHHVFKPEEVATSEQAAGQVALAIFKGKLLAAEREQRVLAEALRDTAEALNGTLNFEEVLDHILSNVGRVVPHDSASIMLTDDPSRAIDPVNGSVRIVRARGFAERGLGGWVTGLRFPVIDSPKIRAMLATRQPVIVSDAATDPDWVVLPETNWIQSHLAAPIGVRGWVIGFLNLDSAVPNFFSEAHAERMRVFADQAAVAIENAYLYDSIRQNADELSFLYRASDELIRPGLQLEGLAAHIATLIAREFGVTYADVWLMDDALLVLRRIAHVGPGASATYEATQLYGPGIVAAVARSIQAVYVPDALAPDRAYAPLHPNVKSILTVPLTGGGQVIGVLELESEGTDAFESRKRRIISAFAERAGLAMENTQLVTRLDLARRTAEEASQLKSEFLANTSHELRTPLTGIIGSLSMVLDDMCDSEAEQREFIQIAYTASEHLLDIINKVLDIAKIEAGRMEVELRPLALAPILAELYAVNRVQADEKMLRLELRLPEEESLHVVAEPEKLRQIMFNLIGNAIKFTERGSVHVTAQALDEAWVQINVKDSGIGVAPDKQAKLFQPFVQADGSMTRKFGGTGLGLSISRRLAEMMGGTLQLESDGINHGTTLRLKLPRYLEQTRQGAENETGAHA